MLLLVQVLACSWAGLYRGMWRFASLADLRRIIKAVLVSTVALFLFTFVAADWVKIPRSIIVLYPLLLGLLMGGARIAWRMYKEAGSHMQAGADKRQPVVIAGAGAAGDMLMRELARGQQWRVVALVDDDRHKQGCDLNGSPIAGKLDDLPLVLEKYQARHVILAMPSVANEVIQRVSASTSAAHAALFTIPGLGELISGRSAINVIRPIEVEDLLGRAVVHIDDAGVNAMISGKRVLVTGAGGSIGSELCRQLASFKPAQVVLFEANEFALYTITQWFSEHQPQISFVSMAGDVRDPQRIQEVFASYQPQLVFHAAAYKHVPLMEQLNAWQAVQNNIGGTLTVARAASVAGCAQMVLVSTDKAVNPTNVMGATKRVAEMICQSLDATSGNTRYSVVRFGNVLGSTGSVIPRFKQQIAMGGPVTVTHPDITRYFMSIPEASQLVLQAAALATGGEVFVLDMGQPVKIVDLARNMIRLSGYTEDEIKIVFSGLRPGEKLYEELLADSERTLPTPLDKLRIAKLATPAAGLLVQLEKWLAQASQDDASVRRVLQELVPEYRPSKRG